MLASKTGIPLLFDGDWIDPGRIVAGEPHKSL